jgi:NAD-dependent deacetylase
VTAVDAARRVLQGAEKTVFVTGAGVSAESGVPTFRGEGGLWRTYRAEELATPQAFARDPRLVWEWYDWRRKKIGACAPNDAHRAIARYCLDHRQARLITQNVDGLHDLALLGEAGRPTLPDHAVPIALHGSIFRVRCLGCGTRTTHREGVDALDESTLPRCDRCGHALRPDVVWFGESLDPVVLDQAMEAAQAADVCVVVGTSALVHPAASIPLLTAERGGLVVEVNPEETPLSRVASVTVRGAAAGSVPQILSDHP